MHPVTDTSWANRHCDCSKLTSVLILFAFTFKGLCSHKRLTGHQLMWTCSIQASTVNIITHQPVSDILIVLKAVLWYCLVLFSKTESDLDSRLCISDIYLLILWNKCLCHDHWKCEQIFKKNPKDLHYIQIVIEETLCVKDWHCDSTWLGFRRFFDPEGTSTVSFVQRSQLQKWMCPTPIWPFWCGTWISSFSSSMGC